MNWFNRSKPTPNIASSILYDEHTFYQAFFKDEVKLLSFGNVTNKTIVRIFENVVTVVSCFW